MGLNLDKPSEMREEVSVLDKAKLEEPLKKSKTSSKRELILQHSTSNLIPKTTSLVILHKSKAKLLVSRVSQRRPCKEFRFLKESKLVNPRSPRKIVKGNRRSTLCLLTLKLMKSSLAMNKV